MTRATFLTGQLGVHSKYVNVMITYFEFFINLEDDT